MTKTDQDYSLQRITQLYKQFDNKILSLVFVTQYWNCREIWALQENHTRTCKLHSERLKRRDLFNAANSKLMQQVGGHKLAYSSGFEGL